jgi:glycosyltransferase involved in cell wall biosynthesis
MKVLMLGWELPPQNSGGLGVACYHLCKALASNNVDIEFVIPYHTTLQVPFMKVTTAWPKKYKNVIRTGLAYDSASYIDSVGDTKHLDLVQQERIYGESIEKVIDLGSFDIIHAHDWLTFRAALKLKAQTGLPLIVHIHSVESDRAGGNKGNPLIEEMEYLGLSLADEVIAVSEHTKQIIIRDYNIPANKIKVVHNSIDRDDLGEIEPENIYVYLQLMKSQGYHVITSVGRLTIQKNVTNMLRAAQKVIEKVPKTLFLVVGDGEQYNELIALSAELGILKNVVFTGFQRGKSWRDSFSIADLFIMPSVSEPFGLTPLEAINYGTPSLISYQSGVSEVLKSCLKVDYWDVDEMANKIVAVLRTPTLRQALKENAEREIHELSWAPSAKKLKKIYDRHLAEVTN